MRERINRRSSVIAYCLLPVACCLLLTAAFSGCGTATNILTPTETDLGKLKTDFPDVTIADLQTGFKLYKTNCSGCHTLHLPTEKNKEQWAEIMPEMFLKTSLKEEEKKLITQYLFAKAK
jgi:cytochrome c1